MKIPPRWANTEKPMLYATEVTADFDPCLFHRRRRSFRKFRRNEMKHFRVCPFLIVMVGICYGAVSWPTQTSLTGAAQWRFFMFCACRNAFADVPVASLSSSYFNDNLTGSLREHSDSSRRWRRLHACSLEVSGEACWLIGLAMIRIQMWCFNIVVRTALLSNTSDTGAPQNWLATVQILHRQRQNPHSDVHF